MSDENLPVVNGVSEEEFIEASNRSSKSFDIKDQTIPFLKILQPLSPQLNDLDGAKAGMFCNVATGKLATNMLVIPLVHCWNYTEWLPDRGGFVRDWGTDEQGWKMQCDQENRTAFRPVTMEGNSIVQARHFYVYDVDEDTGDIETCIFPFTGTMLTRAKLWSSKIIYSPKIKTSQGLFRAPFYYYTYRMTTELIKRGTYRWYLPVITLNMKEGKAVSTLDLPNGRSIWEAAKDFEKSFDAGEIRISAPQVEEGF
jgi:hypothetical protein